MTQKIKILAICGSTRKNSSNVNLIKAIVELTSEHYTINILKGLDEIPHFNPDLDNAHPPKEVANFRKQVKEADGVIICSPEYAMGVPGTLKNAIDWTVSSMEFSNKPVALVTASVSGEKAHRSLLDTLLILEARMTEETQVLISYVKTKVNVQGKITDVPTLESINKLTQSLTGIINKDLTNLLSEPILSVEQ